MICNEGCKSIATRPAPDLQRKYRVHRLVYFEIHELPSDAIAREKHIKNWHRAWKINLIERDNPDWNELPAPMTY